MKFPSVKTLASGAVNTIKRFPFEILFALAGTVAMIFKIRHNFFYGDEDSLYNRVMMVANLGLLLSLAATLFTERKGHKRITAASIRIFAAIAGALLFFALNPEFNKLDYLRFFLFCLAFHLLVSFAAFIGTGKIQGFWQFNKVLFIRILTSALYSGVLYLGLILAIYATVSLFNINIGNGHIYGYLFAVIAGIFNTLFFLAGVPGDMPALDEDFSYPKGLKVFTQYVLIPLATIYLLILLAYEVKIIIEWRMPKGLVSSLVLGYAVFGILSILLIYPVRDHDGNRWIKTYSRWFYFLMIPLIVLLYLATFARIVPYGITEERYFLLALALWLTFICVYFLLSRKQNIRVIPISLCLLTLVVIYGPFSAFSISENSQRGKLIGLFEKYGSFKDGKLIPLHNKHMTQKDAKEAKAKLRYLTNNKDMSELQRYFSQDLSEVSDSLENATTNAEEVNIRRYKSAKVLVNKDRHHDDYYWGWQRAYDQLNWLTKYLELDKFSDNKTNEDFQYNLYSSELADIKGYDYMISINERVADTAEIPVAGIKVISASDNQNRIFAFKVNNEMVTINAFHISDSLKKVCDKLKPTSVNTEYDFEVVKSYTLPNESMTVIRKTKDFDIAFKLYQLSFTCEDGKLKSIEDLTGFALIRRR